MGMELAFEMLNDAKIKAAKPREKSYRLGDSGQLYLQVTPSGGRHWRMNYAFGKNAQGKPAQKTLSFGSQLRCLYAGCAGQPYRGSARGQARVGVADVVTSASYAAGCTSVATCNQPTATTDARGGVTNYSYDASHGGLLSATLPAPVAGAARPEVRIGYETRQAQIRDASGGIVGSGQNVVLPQPGVGLNQHSAAGSVARDYDARGNLTSSGTTSYAYSVENMLTGASTGATLGYDPKLRLYQVGGTRFQYDGLALIGEYDGAGGVMRRYVHGPGVDEPIV